ncbi:hypothetical protein AAES_58054 [Amazona aestiva]|uniref:Uncharacterized protein n=1 Tax=Amazona aestiva TaxID=12930 RepID=A0A0Q3XB86_AMAAE|nr:hypothetical protein AAES_58054 [Amazona aestiva]
MLNMSQDAVGGDLGHKEGMHTNPGGLEGVFLGSGYNQPKLFRYMIDPEDEAASRTKVGLQVEPMEVDIEVKEAMEVDVEDDEAVEVD